MRRQELLMAGALAAAVWSAGCARQVAQSRRTATPPTAVAATMRRQILNAADAGEGDTVANQLRRKIAASPDDVAARLELATHYGKQGLPELELEHLRLAAERFAASAPVQIALARALRKAGQPRLAAESLVSFLVLNPSTSSVEALNLLGFCYDEASDWKAGEQAFRQALTAGNHLDYLHNNLGYNLLQQQRVAEGVAEFRRALELNPRSETAHNNLGLALARSPGVSLSEALQHFEAVAGAATANSNLAAALMEQSRYEESRQLLEAALGYSRTHGPALANLRLLSELDGRPAELHPRTKRNALMQPLAFFRWMFLPGSESREERSAGSGKTGQTQPRKGEKL